jgi:hypothetical protein
VDDLAAEVSELLNSIGGIDPKKLARRSALGEEFSLEEAVGPIQKTVAFFRSFPRDSLDELPDGQLEQVKQQALALLNVIQQLQGFSPSKTDNPAATRQSLLEQARGTYINAFNSLYSYVAFLASKQRDISGIEEQARAATATATEEAAKLRQLLTQREQEANDILQKVRDVAAEQGVSQQAAYFKEEAEEHDNLAKDWEGYTIRVAIGLGVYALATALFAVLYTPENAYQAVQLGLSKVLIFAVIAYMLFHCARTTLAHRHNAVVNHHRENALLTFNALTSAAADPDKRDIVLTHAASCIFSPQETGYTKQAAIQGPGLQVVEALPRIAHLAGQA